MVGSTSPVIAQEKRTLASVLQEHRAIPTAQAVDVALDVCDALAAAHANGVVHGDLGPQCIRLAWPPDAGAERGQRAGGIDIFARADGSGATPHKQLAAIVAPEQREVGRVIDVRTDVFAVGSLLHRMLGGVVLNGRPSTLVRVPRTLVQIIDACMAEDVNERPESVDVLTEKLASYASSPADRFQRLAARRAAAEKLAAALAREGVREAHDALDRLDNAALTRAKVTPEETPVVEYTEPLVPAQSENRLVIARIDNLVTPAPFEVETRVAIDPVDAVAAVAAAEAMPDSVDEELVPLDAIVLEDDEGEDLETQWVGTEPLTLPLEPRVAALSIAPVEVPSNREIASEPPPAMPLRAPETVPPMRSRGPAWVTVAAVVGVAACLVIGIAGGVQATRYITAAKGPKVVSETPVTAQTLPAYTGQTPKAEPPPPAAPPPPVVSAAPSAAPAKKVAPAPTDSVPVFEVVKGQVVRTATPDSLPDAK